MTGEHDFFRLLVESIKDYAIFLLDPDGNVATWNSGAVRAKGYVANEIVGKHFSLFYSAEDVADGRPQRLLQQARDEGRVEDEGWRVRKDGTRFWANVVITALRDDKGELVGFAKVTRDLTQRQHAEEAARRLGEERAARNAAVAQAKRLQALASTTAALSAVMLPEQVAETVVSHVSEALGARATAFYMMRPDDTNLELVASSYADKTALARYQRISLDEALTLDKDQLDPGAGLVVSYPLLIGEELLGVLVLSFGDPASVGEEDRTLAVSIAHQASQAMQRAFLLVRDRKHAERDAFLAEATRTLSSTIDYEKTLTALAQLVVPRLGDWCVIDAASREGETPRQMALAAIDDETQRAVLAMRQRFPHDASGAFGVPKVLRTGESELYATVNAEVLGKLTGGTAHATAAGEIGLTSAMMLPLRARGRVVAAIGIAATKSRRHYDQEDLDFAEELARRAGTAIENAELYAEAKEAVAFRDEFLAVASHDLRTPLSTLTLQVQGMIMARESSADEREKKRLGRIDRELGRLSKLIDKLLDVSRIHLGTFRMERERMSLLDVVREVVDRFEDETHKASCTAHVEADDVTGNWDRTRIDQVVTNLFANAIKYGAGRPIHLSISRIGDRARLTVRDHGIGISPDDADRIFEKFERAVSGRYYSGVGIGLWIVKQIVTAHGGTVSVTPALGGGSLFVVELPTT